MVRGSASLNLTTVFVLKHIKNGDFSPVQINVEYIYMYSKPTTLAENVQFCFLTKPTISNCHRMKRFPSQRLSNGPPHNFTGFVTRRLIGCSPHLRRTHTKSQPMGGAHSNYTNRFSQYSHTQCFRLKKHKKWRSEVCQTNVILYIMYSQRIVWHTEREPSI